MSRRTARAATSLFTKAVNFYADYLAGLESSILPTAVQSAIDGRMGRFEDRIQAPLDTSEATQANYTPPYYNSKRSPSARSETTHAIPFARRCSTS